MLPYVLQNEVLLLPPVCIRFVSAFVKKKMLEGMSRGVRTNLRFVRPSCACTFNIFKEDVSEAIPNIPKECQPNIPLQCKADIPLEC